MSDNYVIKAADNSYFGGWNRLGMITMKPEKDYKLAYRMSGTVARRNLHKIVAFTGMECVVEKFQEVC